MLQSSVEYMAINTWQTGKKLLDDWSSPCLHLSQLGADTIVQEPHRSSVKAEPDCHGLRKREAGKAVYRPISDRVFLPISQSSTQCQIGSLFL